MYKEANSKKANLSVILVFVVLAIVLHTLLGILPILTIVKDIAFIMAMVVFVLIFIKKYMTTYEYELYEDKIVISAILGGRPRTCIEANLDAIKCFCPVADEQYKNFPGDKLVMCT